MVKLTIDGQPCEVAEGATLLSAAAAAGVYIPTLCSHPDLVPFRDLPAATRVYRGSAGHDHTAAPAETLRQLEGCGLCVVEVAGQPQPLRACQTTTTDGLDVRTNSPALVELRRLQLMKILARHPHACLTCAQREGCSLENCSSNVPREERCCSKFHNCELRRVAEYVGIKPETPRYRPAGLAALRDEPLFTRDYNLCIDCTRCVRACNQLRGVGALGLVHQDGRLVVGSVAPALRESGCRFCGACVEVCPTGCLLDKSLPAGPRDAALVPCRHTCPAGVDVPGYIRRIAAGDLNGAAALLWETLPLPGTLGHICFHLCEEECRRSQLDEPIAICALKRFAVEAGDPTAMLAKARTAETGKRVAVIGGGPAGLSAAYFLRLKGHAVTVFEAAGQAGGMPALSIPEYRLPPAVLAKDVDVIRRLGVEIRTGARLPSASAMSALLGDGYAALLVAVGLPEPKRVPIPGSELANVFWGLEFLTAVKAGRRFELGRQVVVIGGGNVAIDVALTARRLGAAVRLYCLERRDEMPAHAQDVARAESEGIEIHPQWGPLEIDGAAGAARRVVLRHCVSVFDEQRNFAPRFSDDETRTVAADAVILAIGQAPPADLPAASAGVFHAGDITGGPLSVVHAVASGRAAAEKVDVYLGGDGDLALQFVERTPPPAWLGPDAEFAFRPRIAPPAPPAAELASSTGEGANSFRELEGTHAPAAACAEARRCLQCDLRLALAAPARPPERWLEFNGPNVERAPGTEGVLVLAEAGGKPLVIKGVPDIRAALRAQLAGQRAAAVFCWEEERLYTKRESELIQQHLQRYGALPGGGDDELSDLF